MVMRGVVHLLRRLSAIDAEKSEFMAIDAMGSSTINATRPAKPGWALCVNANRPSKPVWAFASWRRSAIEAGWASARSADGAFYIGTRLSDFKFYCVWVIHISYTTRRAPPVGTRTLGCLKTAAHI